MRRGSRSKFDAIPAMERTNLREAAVTMAQQGLRKPMVQASDARPGGSTPMVRPDDAPAAGGAPNERPIHRRPQTGHPPGNQGGTYNGTGAGSTAPDTEGGVELMARVIVNQTNATSSSAPKHQQSQKPPAWPNASHEGASDAPYRPNRRRH